MNSLYPYERIELIKTCKELHISTNEAFNQEIAPEITFFDTLKFKRMFRILSNSFSCFLKNKYGDQFHKDENIRSLVLESIIPVIKEEKFLLDGMAIMDDYLFIFECKNTLHPTDMFQLRTSYDYIKKGGAQLTFFRNSFASDLKEKLSRKLGIDLSGITKVITAIIMGNRMFSGYMIDNNIVCNVFELSSFIATGKINIAGEVISLWKSDTFHKEDLAEYLGQNSYIRKRMCALTQYDKCFNFKKHTLVLKSYYLDCAKPPNETLFSIIKTGSSPF